jgi:hypothetical protein
MHNFFYYNHFVEVWGITIKICRDEFFEDLESCFSAGTPVLFKQPAALFNPGADLAFLVPRQSA